MFSVSMKFNLHYKIFSETTSMFAVVLLVVVIFLMVKRSYRRCFQSPSVGGLNMDHCVHCVCSKPIPEENGEKNCEVRNMSLKKLSNWEIFIIWVCSVVAIIVL